MTFCLFTELDVAPYTQMDPDVILQARRLEVMERLLRKEPSLIVASAQAVIRRLPPLSFLGNTIRSIQKGELLKRDSFLEELLELGYEESPLVDERGTLAKRGALVDFWPPHLASPVRLELEDELIISLRFFHPGTQRSKEDIHSVKLHPLRDFLYSEKTRDQALQKIRILAERSEMPASERRSLTEQIRERISFPGLDSFFHLFHETTSTFNDYTSHATVLIDEPHVGEAHTTTFLTSLRSLVETSQNRERIVPVEDLFLPFSELIKHFSSSEEFLEINTLRSAPQTLSLEGNTELRALVEKESSSDRMLSSLRTKIKTWLAEEHRIFIVCHTDVQAMRLADLLQSDNLTATLQHEPILPLLSRSSLQLSFVLGRASKGFRWYDQKLIVISEEELFGTKKLRRATSAPPPSEPFTSFSELAEGDYLVHEHHGIARFGGLVHLSFGKEVGDYLLLSYLGDDKLYLPVYRMNLVQRYIGAGESFPLLDRLGGTRWKSIQKRVRQEMQSIAKEILKIAAERQLRTGTAFPPPDESYEAFSAAFPYDETPDQERAIQDVMRDMETTQPMDRLICGDVGYGKTEVAMRAAMRATMAGKQVAVLVPTTILAFQHFETFTQRFQKTPATIEMISRFRSTREQIEILEKVKKGSVDILIGTHRLLQKDIEFRDLGLLIVDEEQRFGVQHKERLKKLKATVEALSMSATPIPRTLNFSLMGMRDISIINTPPANRQSIATHVAPFDENLIRHAIRQEIARGGQIFFVHNRVETIGSLLRQLKTIVPEARIAMGHGQMNETELEKVMVDFYHHQYDVLLCTTIIESGLDIPNANTIIVHRADMLGLSQLYQLRGRVGRSDRKAYAYLLIPADGTTTAIAKRRLSALARFTALGSGFQIAMHDLEIRGAGNLLGRDQSGHIADVGYELYIKLLERTIRTYRGEKDFSEIDPELHLSMTALLPQNYITDDGARLEMYRRLSNRRTEDEVDMLAEEMIDRFGALPLEVKNLIDVMNIKIFARELRLLSVSFDGTRFNCECDSSTPIDPTIFLKLQSKHQGTLKLVPPNHIHFHPHAEAMESLKSLLRELLSYVTARPS